MEAATIIYRLFSILSSSIVAELYYFIIIIEYRKNTTKNIMSQVSPSSPIKNDIVLGVDGKPKNKAYTNMFQEEIILTEKQKLRIDLVQNKSKMKKLIKTMTPSDLFSLFDEDDSGLISYEEFRKMLPFLDIVISDAKAFRYFRLCDSDGSGEIDFDEFKVALFICDPVSIVCIFVHHHSYDHHDHQVLH